MLVKTDGPAAFAGLETDEYLHSVMVHAGHGAHTDNHAMVPLNSSADFDSLVTSTVPGDILCAKVYALTRIVLTLFRSQRPMPACAHPRAACADGAIDKQSSALWM